MHHPTEMAPPAARFLGDMSWGLLTPQVLPLAMLGNILFVNLMVICWGWLGKKWEERRREIMMRARERAKRNADRKKEENLANGVPSNASSTVQHG